MEGSVPVAGQGLYAQPSLKGQELASFKHAQLLIDFTSAAFNSSAGIAGTLSTGVNYEIHGDWLYVDPSSVGAVQCSLYSESDDSQTVCLQPGQVVKTRFDRIKVFASACVTTYQSFSNQGSIANPCLRIWYGIGKCPFLPVQLIGSTQPVANANLPTPQTQTASAYATQLVGIPPGAWIDASAGFSQVTAAGETSILFPTLLFANPGDTLSAAVAPDFLTGFQQTTSGVGKSYILARWRCRAPRLATQVQIVCTNDGSATTNNINAQNVLNVTVG